jgi:putative SOS response-associated peptidase YedK
VDGPTETAESTIALAVIDFDPGRRTVARTGWVAVGAVHGLGRADFVVTRISLPVARVWSMCGRYATTRSSPDLSQLFSAFDETGGELEPDYNVAPTDPTPIVRVSETLQRRALTVARWGLIPSWADSPRVGVRMINARAETVATARAFASSFQGRRCLVPVDGWFEWLERKPFYMTVPDGLAFGGLWTQNRFGISCAIVTTAAMGRLTKVHSRMPLLVQPERWEEWLSAPADPALLTQASLGYINAIELRPVGAAIGNVRNDGPSLIEPVEQESLF